MADWNDFGKQPPRGADQRDVVDSRDRKALYEPPYGSEQVNRGGRRARTALITGLISIFVFGLVLGPVAVWLGRRARGSEGESRRASVAIALGWIAFGLWLFGLALGYGIWQTHS